MAVCDFVVRFNPDVDSMEDVAYRIIDSVFLGRIRAKKPVVIFISGDSGEGKSYSALRFEEILLGLQGLSLGEFINDVNVYTPLEYPKKMDALLYDKRLKKVNVIAVHEAREIVKAKLWRDFLTQSVGDINAMSRSVKRMVFIIISQFIRDIAPDIRYTLNYYITVRRPKNKKARLYINVMWKDDRDLEKPKLRKRKLAGYLVLPSGRYKRFVPQYLELTKPSRNLADNFDKQDTLSKSGIIKRKISRLIEEMSVDVESVNEKVESMVDFYVKNEDSLRLIGKQGKKGWKLNPEFRSMHDLSPAEVDDFSSKLNERLKEKGVIEDG